MMALEDSARDAQNEISLEELEWIRDLVQSFGLPSESAKLAAMLALYELIVTAKREAEAGGCSSEDG